VTWAIWPFFLWSLQLFIFQAFPIISRPFQNDPVYIIFIKPPIIILNAAISIFIHRSLFIISPIAFLTRA
jgi:hypothetical protein